MQNIFRKAGILIVVGTALAVSACASTDDVQKAQSTADQALTTAQQAQQTAQQAQTSANSAQQSVQQVQSDLNNLKQQVDQMNQPKPKHHHHRGERG